MNNFYQNFIQRMDHDYTWIVYVFLVVLLTLVGAYFLRITLDRLEQKTKNSHNLWNDSLIGALQAHCNWFVWLLGVSFAADILGYHTETDVSFITDKIRSVGLVILSGWFLVRLVSNLEANFTDPKYQNKPMDPTTAQAIGKLLRAAVVITATLIVMQHFGYSISGILAFGGIGGLAIGLAAKDMLANFFGGLTVYLDKPFKVGDWVRSPDKEIEGIVEDIGWRLTRIKTFEKRPLYVPNSTFTQISLENPSRMLNRRIFETVGIRYDDALKMSDIVQQVEKMIKQHPDVDTEQIVLVNFTTFASSSLNFFICAYTKTTN